MSELFKCTECGAESKAEDVDFVLAETAQLVCPVCKSKIELSAMLVEPGEQAPAPEGEPLPEPEPGEEVPAGEEAPAPEAAPGEEAPAAPAGGGGEAETLEIVPAESVSARVSKALSELDKGKSLQEVLGSLLAKRPMKLYSPKKLGKVVGLRTEGRYTNLTPSPSQYRHLLQIIIQHSTDPASRRWARNELARVKDVTSWSAKIDVSPAKDLYHGGPVAGVPESKRLKEELVSDEDWSVITWDWEEQPDVDMFKVALEPLGINVYEDPAREGSDSVSFVFSRHHLSSEDLTHIKEMLTTESATQSEKPLTEKDDEMKDWQGDFATFNSKLFGTVNDLHIPMDQIECVIKQLQEKDAIRLNNDKVKVDLKKTKGVFVDYLKGQDKDAEEQAAATDLSAPPPRKPDLGSEVPPTEVRTTSPAPQVGTPTEGKKVVENEEISQDIDEKVEMILRKYFV